MAGDTHEDAQAHPPQHPREATHCEKDSGEGELEEPPTFIECADEGIISDFGFDRERGWGVEIETVKELPTDVAEIIAAVGEVIMAVGEALCPIPHVVGTDNLGGATHTDEGADEDQKTPEPWDGVEAAVDHQAVHTDRVAEQECEISGDREEGDRRP